MTRKPWKQKHNLNVPSTGSESVESRISKVEVTTIFKEESLQVCQDPFLKGSHLPWPDRPIQKSPEKKKKEI